MSQKDTFDLLMDAFDNHYWISLNDQKVKVMQVRHTLCAEGLIHEFSFSNGASIKIADSQGSDNSRDGL